MKATTISIIVGAILIGGAIIITQNGGNASNVGNARLATGTGDSNVSVVDGKQIIEIRAKGGYQPRKSLAKAGLPTIIRFNTSGTFDCSSSVRIPSLNISRALPQSGSTDIDIGIGKVGILHGTCGMGMYPFEVEFEG